MLTPAEDGFSAFDALLQRSDQTTSPWVGGRHLPDLDLLRKMLSIPISVGDRQETGRPAKAFDAWVANELRRAGFPADGVFPRMQRPRVLAEGAGDLESRLSELAEQLRTCERDGTRIGPPALRKAIRSLTSQKLGTSTAYILGDFYSKQIDVGLSSWMRGPDILISTKTMFSAYGKNLKNRHEEAVGEVSSLRRRHPMAAMGYAYLVRQDILTQPSAYATLYDILFRLRRKNETFDATLLLVIDWDDKYPERGITMIDAPAPELSPSQFFTDMVECVIDRTPGKIHQEVRRRRGHLAVGGLEPEDDADDFLSQEDGE